MKTRSLTPKRYVRFKPGVLLFSVVLFVSLCAGSYLRYRIQSFPINEKIQNLISENPNVPVQVTGVRLQFRRGWLPAFAISAETLTAADKNCKDRNVVGRGLFIPLGFVSLIQGEVKAKRVVVQSLVTTFPKECEEGFGQQSVSESKKSVPSKDSASSGDRQIVPQKIFTFYQDVLQKFDIPKIIVEDLQLFVVHESRTEVQIHGAIVMRTLSSGVHTLVTLKKAWIGGSELPLNKGMLEINLSSESLDVDLDTQLREGRIQAQGGFKNDLGITTNLSLNVKKLPVSILTNLFVQNVRLRYLWFDCKMQLTSSFKRFYSSTFPLKSCAASGPYGSISMHSPEMTLEKPQNISVDFRDLDLDEILKGKRDVYLSGIFASFGKFSGDLVYNNDLAWDFRGQLLRSEVLFSRNSLRELQKITTLPITASLKDSVLKVTLAALEIDQGLFQGTVELEIDRQIKNGKLKISADSLALSPKIYRLMLKAQNTPFSIYGSVDIKDGEIASWSGVASAAKLVTMDAEFENVKMESLKLVEEAPSFVVTAQKGVFQISGALKEWLGPTTLETKWPETPMAFTDFSVGLQKNSSRENERSWDWQWQRGRLNFANGWRLGGEGRVRSDKNVEGWVQWDLPTKAPLRWEYAGAWGRARWTPREPWMIQWLKENQKFLLDNPRINFEVPSDKSAALLKKKSLLGILRYGESL